MSEDTRALGDGRDFTLRPRWQRFLVYLAGPAMNAALTVAVLTVFHMIGFGVDAAVYEPPIVGAVEAGSPAEAAGIAAGDRIVSIDGRPQPTWEDVQYDVAIRPDTELRLRLLRGVEEREVVVRTTTAGKERRGKLGVSPVVRIGKVREGSAAEAAGLLADDGILSVDGRPVVAFSDLVVVVTASNGQALELRLLRGDTVRTVRVAPKDQGEGPKLGIEPKTVIKKYGLLRAVKESCVWTWDMTRKTFDVLRKLVTAEISPKTMMGPLGIARASGDAARSGPGQLFFLVALVSLQVGILNLFPLAPLDGGHLAILAGEAVIRRDLSENVKVWIMNAGAVVLLCLIVLVVYSDLSKISAFGRFLP